MSFSDFKQTTKHAYEYGKPPAELAGVDGLVTAAIKALKACQGDGTVVILGVCPLGAP